MSEKTDNTLAGGRRVGRVVAGWLWARRPLLAAGTVLALVTLAGLAGDDRKRRGAVAADDGAQMARAEWVIDSLNRSAEADEAVPLTAASRLDDAGVVALGYLARAQLGVGSPFRLAAFAMRDTRLPVSLGRSVAWGILTRAISEEAYALAPLGAARSSVSPDPRQWTVADSVVGAATNARTGEAAVRIGYALAAQEGVVSHGTASAAVQWAAQRRDRRLAREDAARLLRASAGDRTTDALGLLVRWRAERRFQVEQPLLSDAMQPNDAAAVRAGIALRDLLRDAAPDASLLTAQDAPRPADTTPDTVDRVVGSAREIAEAVLPPRTARRLAELESVRHGPPQAPVAVAVAAYRRQLARASAADADRADRAERTPVDAARRRFAERVRSEETLAAELSIAAHAAGGLPADLAGVAAAAAVGMRAFAQDTVSPLVVDGPTADLLRARFGVRAVTFDASVPTSWRPYYLSQLAGAMDDLRTVMPWIDFDGLAVRVGESVKRDSALALHDPTSRTVYLPTATGAGTIAHELAHDLDWQTATTQLAVRGTYSTDRAMRDGRGSLGASVRGLAAARPRSAGAWRGGGEIVERPAELFARGVDWFVAASLAAGGRMNGALSAVQDEALTGYAGVVSPEARDGAADALVGVLTDMTVVPSASRAWFLGRYGMDGAPSAQTILRLVASAPSRAGTERTLRGLSLVGGGCVGDTPAVTATNWRAVLLRAAAESRARGALRARGRRWAAPTHWSWEARSTLGGPWSPAMADSAVARGRDALLRAVAWEDGARHPLATGAVSALALSEFVGCR